MMRMFFASFVTCSQFGHSDIEYGNTNKVSYIYIYIHTYEYKHFIYILYIYIYIQKHANKVPFASASGGKHLLFVKSVLFRNDGDTKPAFLYFQGAPAALGPISSCSASETNGN